jgi:hypothetical protein
MARQEREVRTFDVTYDDDDDRLHVNVTHTTEVTTGRGREWQQGERRYETDVLILTRDEFAALVRQGLGTLSYQVGLVRSQGVRIDYRTEKISREGSA